MDHPSADKTLRRAAETSLAWICDGVVRAGQGYDESTLLHFDVEVVGIRHPPIVAQEVPARRIQAMDERPEGGAWLKPNPEASLVMLIDTEFNIHSAHVLKAEEGRVITSGAAGAAHTCLRQAAEQSIGTVKDGDRGPERAPIVRMGFKADARHERVEANALYTLPDLLLTVRMRRCHGCRTVKRINTAWLGDTVAITHNLRIVNSRGSQ